MPDFALLGGSILIGEYSSISDRYGNQYSVVSIASGLDFGFDVMGFEGYLSPFGMGSSTFNTDRQKSTLPSESDIKTFLSPSFASGFTVSGGIFGFLGRGVSFNENSIAVLYGGHFFGAGVDMTVDGEYTGKDAQLGWDWIGKNGTSFSKADIRLHNEGNVGCECN